MIASAPNLSRLLRLAALLAAFAWPLSAAAAPILYTIQGDLDGTSDTVVARILYEGSTPDSEVDPDTGRFSGGLLGFEVTLNGVAVPFGAFSMEGFSVNSGPSFALDQLNGSFESGPGPDQRYSFTTEWNPGDLAPSGMLPMILPSGTPFGRFSLLTSSLDVGGDILVITAEKPIPEPSAAMLFALGGLLVGASVRRGPRRQPGPGFA